MLTAASLHSPRTAVACNCRGDTHRHPSFEAAVNQRVGCVTVLETIGARISVRGLSVCQCDWGCCGRSRPVEPIPTPCSFLVPLHLSLSHGGQCGQAAVPLLIHCQCMPGICKAGDSPQLSLPPGFCPEAMTHLSLRGAPAIQVNILPHTHTLCITQGPTSPMRIHTWTQRATCPASI